MVQAIRARWLNFRFCEFVFVFYGDFCVFSSIFLLFFQFSTRPNSGSVHHHLSPANPTNGIVAIALIRQARDEIAKKGPTSPLILLQASCCCAALVGRNRDMPV
ncbi:hypothetical protein ACFFJ7_17630 [Pseudochelatococcus lubricantis]|uniref:hypothetical protein n=1 Tax=Pseudochelatococcus lubricantis TaxID=1538102 RepID=UPI0035EC78C5